MGTLTVSLLCLRFRRAILTDLCPHEAEVAKSKRNQLEVLAGKP
jgi:hypothetical protein